MVRKEIGLQLNYSAELEDLYEKTNLCIAVLNAGIDVRFRVHEFQSPLRDYSEKPFKSEEWLAGDVIERGRMVLDVYKLKIPNGKSKEEVVKLFGEPEKKVAVEGREVWLYRAENKFHNELNLFPI